MASNGSHRLQGRVRERLAQRYRQVDGQMARWLIEAGMTWLKTNQEVVNNLNVFPVPDGDTGTNMVLTMQAAWEELAGLEEDASIAEVMRSISHGALMGARGNSGVILSQLWRGFSRALDDSSVMDAELFVQALQEARETAYRGVVRPVEGTILTVSTDMATAAQAALEAGAYSNLHILEAVVEAGDASVITTEELNPVLKEAGVVDAGGKGLYFLLEGMLRSVQGQALDEPLITVEPLSALGLERSGEVIEPGQDWEVVIDFRPKQTLDVKSFYSRLEAMGTSIQVGEGDGLYRMHIHVPDRTEYEPIEYIKTLGDITNVAIENLMLQMRERAGQIQLAQVQAGQIAAIAVSPGAGLSNVLGSLGAGWIVSGGQTMNPSTEQILAAISELPTDRVIVLPNNKNIILAAEQAAKLTDKQARVVPSASVPEGIAALLHLDPGGELDQVAQAMTAALREVKSGEITIATRSVRIEGVRVSEGQLIGLLDDQLVVAHDSLAQVTLGLLRAAEAQEAELITLYYGADLTAERASAVRDEICQSFPEQEIELFEGGQPHYLLILSIE